MAPDHVTDPVTGQAATSSTVDPPARDHVVVRVVHGISRGFAVIAATGIVAMLALTVADIASRKFVGPGIAGAYEVTEIGLAAVAFAGMAAAEYHKTHVRTPIFLDLLPRRAADIVHLTGLVVVVLCLVFLIYVTTKTGVDAYESGEYRFGLSQVPVWPARLFIPFGVTAMLLEFLVDVVRLARHVVTRGPYPESGISSEQLREVPL